MRISAKALSVVLFASVTVMTGAPSLAQDTESAEQQGDDQISVWVDNVSLSTFISQLAEITGREAVITSELEGQLSGRFNGSMTETLSTVGEQFGVLFDLDKGTLGAVSETARSRATIPLGESSIDEQTRQSLMSDLLPGNDVQVREGEVVVVGHPGFVKRVARQVTAAVAGAGQQSSVEITPIDVAADIARDTSQLLEADLPEAEVVDAAAQVMLEEAADESAGVNGETETASSPATIRWVTDIPGYETF